MIKKVISLLILVGLFLQIHAQERLFIIGAETAGQYHKLYEHTNNPDFLFYTKFAPFVSYFPTKYRGYGLVGEHSFVSSSFYSRKETWGYGVFVRHYLPPILFKSDYLNDFLNFFSELSYHRTNYYPKKVRQDEDVLPEAVVDKININVLKFHLGTNIKVFKIFDFDSNNFLKHFKFLNELRMELSYRPELYIQKNFQHTFRLGLEYTFNKNANTK